MKVRNILGISGGKDSAALAIYLKQKYPNLKIEYYNSDTGCELAETELLIDRLSAYLGNIKRLRAAEDSPEPTPFEHFLKAAGGFLPSPQARWCTKKMKLDEFERYVGDDYAVSYVGIRGDEDRDGYVSSNLIFSLSFLSEEISGAWMSSISSCTKKTRSRLLTSTISCALRD